MSSLFSKIKKSFWNQNERVLYRCCEMFIANPTNKQLVDVFVEYVDKILIPYGNNFNEYIRLKSNDQNHNTIVYDLFKLKNVDVIIKLLDILINRYAFDVNKYVYMNTFINNDSYLYIYKSLLYIILVKYKICNEKLLDIIIDKYGYNVNTMCTTRCPKYIIVSNLLEDIMNTTIIKNENDRK